MAKWGLVFLGRVTLYQPKLVFSFQSPECTFIVGSKQWNLSNIRSTLFWRMLIPETWLWVSLGHHSKTTNSPNREGGVLSTRRTHRDCNTLFTLIPAYSLSREAFWNIPHRLRTKGEGKQRCLPFSWRPILYPMEKKMNLTSNILTEQTS